MAQKVEVVLTCDLDSEETPAVETVTFSYDGQAYEFELCESHLAEFHGVLGRYASAARPSGGRRRPAVARATRSARGGRNGDNPSELATVREWARAHGFEVSDRGRIPGQVRDAYEAAQR